MVIDGQPICGVGRHSERAPAVYDVTASIGLRSPWPGLVLLPLLLLFLLLHLLLLGFFFVFLATFVSHARSCSINMTRDGECQTLLSKTSAFLVRRQDPLISEDYSPAA